MPKKRGHISDSSSSSSSEDSQSSDSELEEKKRHRKKRKNVKVQRKKKHRNDRKPEKPKRELSRPLIKAKKAISRKYWQLKNNNKLKGRTYMDIAAAYWSQHQREQPKKQRKGLASKDLKF